MTQLNIISQLPRAPVKNRFYGCQKKVLTVNKVKTYFNIYPSILKNVIIVRNPLQYTYIEFISRRTITPNQSNAATDNEQ